MKFVMMYWCHVVLDEDEYVYVWRRWMKMLEDVKKAEAEALKRAGRGK